MQYAIYNHSLGKFSDEIPKLIENLCELINYDYISKDIAENFITLSKQNNLVTFIALDGEDLAGILGFYLTPEIFNSNKIRASEAFWYMKPEYRGYGLQLLKYAEKQFSSGLTIELGIAIEKLLDTLLKKGYCMKKTIIEKVL